MPGRRKKKPMVVTTADNYVKDGRKASTVKRIRESQARWKIKVGNSDKAGNVLIDAWEKDGKVVNVDPTPPPFLRAEMRENRYGDGSSRRVGCTVPSPEIRRVRSRRRNKIAKASRKGNR